MLEVTLRLSNLSSVLQRGSGVTRRRGIPALSTLLTLLIMKGSLTQALEPYLSPGLPFLTPVSLLVTDVHPGHTPFHCWCTQGSIGGIYRGVQEGVHRVVGIYLPVCLPFSRFTVGPYPYPPPSSSHISD